MDDIAEKVSALLNDPESFEKIKNIAGLLSAQNDSPPPEPEKDTQPSGEGGLSGLLNSENLLKLLPLLNEWNAESKDPQVALLLALKPYMSADRSKRIDDAITVLKLSKIASKAMEIL
ncbi:MAG: hypothetical protein Q8865_07235 [Bacillota bacterium]|nr:hypothetical protein [Bacillota bacterium]